MFTNRSHSTWWANCTAFTWNCSRSASSEYFGWYVVWKWGRNSRQDRYTLSPSPSAYIHLWTPSLMPQSGRGLECSCSCGHQSHSPSHQWMSCLSMYTDWPLEWQDVSHTLAVLPNCFSTCRRGVGHGIWAWWFQKIASDNRVQEINCSIYFFLRICLMVLRFIRLWKYPSVPFSLDDWLYRVFQITYARQGVV